MEKSLVIHRIKMRLHPRKGFLGGSVIKKKKKNSPANAGDKRDMGLIHWVGKIPGRRKWQPTPVFLPGKSPTDRVAWWATVQEVPKELDTT